MRWYLPFVLLLTQSCGQQIKNSALKTPKYQETAEAPLSESEKLKQTIFHAISTHQYLVLKNILEKDVNLNIYNPEGETPLTASVRENNLEIFKLILRYTENIDHKNKSGNTALLLAIKNKRFKLAQILIENKANLYITDTQYKTPLLLAIQADHIETVTSLIEHGADIEDLGEVFQESFNMDQMTNNSLIREVLNTKVLISSHSPSVDDVIAILKSENVYAIRLLLNECSLKEMIQETDLMARILEEEIPNKHYALKVMIINKSLQPIEGLNITHHAAALGDTEALSLLFQNRFEVEQMDQDGFTPLVHAVENNQLESVKLLLNLGAKVIYSNPNNTKKPRVRVCQFVGVPKEDRGNKEAKSNMQMIKDLLGCGYL
jgi:ankyrin repeat protein